MKSKKILIIIFLCLNLFVFCTSEKGDTGPVGPAGIDSIASKVTYYFNPVGNPYTHFIPEIDLIEFEAGNQIINVYHLNMVSEWVELPITDDTGVDIYMDICIIGDGYVKLVTYENGVLFAGDAINGWFCMVIVIELN